MTKLGIERVSVISAPKKEEKMNQPNEQTTLKLKLRLVTDLNLCTQGIP